VSSPSSPCDDAASESVTPGHRAGLATHLEAVYRRELDPHVEYRYRIDILTGTRAVWTAMIWRDEDYLGTASGKVGYPPREEVLLNALVEAEVREIIDTRFSRH
jgi:hypothetical protein